MSALSSFPSTDAPNHPLAVRMGVVAGISSNVVIGTAIGSFSVMLAFVQTRLGILPEEASAGIPILLVGASVIAPAAGVLLGKFSLRMIMFVGALMLTAGFLLLAFSNSYAMYLLAYGLFLGPAMSLTGSIGPSTLVTRWFNRKRGLALGLANLSILIAIMPVALNWFVTKYGATAGYLGLAGLSLIVLAPVTLLAINHPPTGETQAPEPAANRTSDGSFSTAQLLARPRFWAMALAAIASMTSSTVLGSLLIPMGAAWGFTRGESALLASLMSLAGIAGSVLFGIIADKIGGGRTLALVAFDCGILWALLLLHPAFPAAAACIALIGMHGTGAIPGLGRAISDAFGQASFSRGFGLNTIIALPIMAVAIIGSSWLSRVNGSFAPTFISMTAFFAVAVVLGLYAAGGRAPDLRASPA